MDGPHTVNVRVYDNANNVAYASVAFKVDTVFPSIIIDSPIGGEIFNVTSVTTQWSGSDATSGIAGYQYKLDNGGWSSSAMLLNHQFALLLDGSHTVYVKITDNAGNVNTTSVVFIVDTVVPGLTITSPSSILPDQPTSVTVTWNGSDLTSPASRDTGTGSMATTGLPSPTPRPMTSPVFRTAYTLLVSRCSTTPAWSASGL